MLLFKNKFFHSFYKIILLDGIIFWDLKKYLNNLSEKK